MKRTTTALTSIPASRHADFDPALQRRIQERAYQLFELRGGVHGYHEEDWLRAERELKATRGPKRTVTGRNNGSTGRSRTKTPKAA